MAAEEIYMRFKKRYGAPRVMEELNAQGIPCSLNYVADLHRERGLKARNGKGFKYCPSTEAMTNVSENTLKRNFEVEAPDLKWVSDITYIKVGRKWLYLAAVMDLYSRRIIGWSLDTHMREQLVLEALNMAVSTREPNGKTLIHSDRGVQYRGNEYQEALKDYGVECSMSRKGNCWDSAAMESFFSRFKVELIYAENYRNVDEARTGIFEYIELFYNRARRHSSIGYVSPCEFEADFNS